MTTLFISYASKDEKWAEWIAWELEYVGYNTKIQVWDFHPGSNFVLNINNSVVESDHIIAVLSNNYLNANFTHSEWTAGFERDPSGIASKLIPIKIDDCKPGGLLDQIVHIDVSGYLEDAAREKILFGVARAIGNGARGKPGLKPEYVGTLDRLDEAKKLAESESDKRSEINNRLIDLQHDLKHELITQNTNLDSVNNSNDFPGVCPSMDLAELMDKRQGDLFLTRELEPYLDLLQRRRRKQEPLKICIALLDIDDLTVITKKFGADVGSHVLIEIVKIMGGLEGAHQFGRCGDDTFYIFLENSSTNQTLKCTSKLLALIRTHDWRTIAPELRVSASAGVVRMKPTELAIEFVIRAANGMRHAKELGGNRVELGPKLLPLEVNTNLRSYFS